VLGTASHSLSVQTPRLLWSEQNPHDWWDAACRSIRQVLSESGVIADEIAGVGLTGQMHGLVLLDDAGKVLRPAILWNDQRTGPQCDEIRARLGSRLIQVTGNDALPGFTAPKIMWVARHEPDVYAQAAHILLPKDYLRYRLTGGFAMDKADGSGTLLFEVRARDWSSEVLAALDIPASWVPPTFEGTEVTGVVSREAAEVTGLRAGTPVVAGGGDQAAGAVGMGAVNVGAVSITVGTSGVIFAPTAEPVIEPSGLLHSFCHAVPGTWHMMGVMLSAAGSLQWYRDSLYPGESFAALVAEAESAPPGSGGLLFLPYLTGERTPHPDPLARGAWVGLNVQHRRAHMTRSLLEGVAFGLRNMLDLLSSAGVPVPGQARIAGGGAQSELWRTIIADVLSLPLVTVNSTEGAAYGAALLAGVSSGFWSSVPAACEAAIRPTGLTEPDAGRSAVYEKYYAAYNELYPALKPTFQRLAPDA
jgi:xylulokinase